MKPVPRPCRMCRKLTTNKSGYCDEHEPQAQEQSRLRQLYAERRRGSPSSRGYDRAWTKFREVFLMEHPLCEKCQEKGIITPAREVHHIKPLADGGAKLDPANCQALCRTCHQLITNEMIRQKLGAS